MTCHNCQTQCNRFGKHRNGLQRFRCRQCRKTFTEDRATPLGTMYTPLDKAARAIQLLVEGCSVSSAERITGIHHTTILSLLSLAGEKCERFLESRIQNVPVADVECDEIWGFVQKKEAHKWMADAQRTDIGDAYTFVGIERTSKLILAWHLGRRDRLSAHHFAGKLRAATASKRFQISTDGFRPYEPAIETAFGADIDYAQLVKVYANSSESDSRYSPGDVVGSVPTEVSGNPNPARICTSHIERQNLTMRMQIRRLTRLTNAFSKKWANLKAALAIHFAWYNFCRVHKSLRMTPAMAAGITDHIWTISELLGVA